MTLIPLILSTITLLNIVVVITLIFFERKNPTATWAWVLILVLFPILGLILYLFIGLTPRKRKIFDRKTEKDLIKNKQLIEGSPNYQGKSLPHQANNIFQIDFGKEEIVYTDNNDVQIYTHGKEKFKELFNVMETAEHHIHISYYIIRNDELGKAIVNKLTKKARQGVTVRVLYDSVGCRKLPKDFFSELEEAGGLVTRFFPFILDINYRNHRKIAVIDGKTAFVGGTNIGKEYLGISQRFDDWRDTHLKVTGDAAKSLQVRFLLDWIFATEEDEDIMMNREFFPEISDQGNSGIQIVASGPDSPHEEIKAFLLKMIYSAKESIYLQTPYFIPDESILEALQIAAYSGVDVRIAIPDKPDHPFVFWANRAYLGLMLETGARGFIYKHGFLHSKLIIVDGKIASVGTANMDVRSFKLNFEVNAFIYDPQMAQRLNEIFLRDLDNSCELTEDQYNQRGISSKFKESISRLLSPIL
ncbi:cardiolipin synthase [Natranaerobius thermophilus]|uniref:Cardiolipin synthase n=1 Tax=Natranaerobius thermophilus (strain ATCC BAA-1301 / DSM 18059 / JW/NM-WN-LF) TaxID=457570 RepID=B2A6V2_NATTJ|nr:cardiolipin synthase [Natranaerobius thermophilus]ACB84233.1 phospholipase D/Transphosphatidylase [Natranaerobius thermophilus JW/NM-WN-LF]